MKIFYFTGTGNSLYVAKSIGGEALSIPQMIKQRITAFEDEAIGFVFPCYCFGVPRIVKQFIEQSTFKADYFFAVMTYGNVSAAGLNQIKDIANNNGINLNYINQIVMVDNYLPLYEIDKQIKNQYKKNIDFNIKTVAEDIKNRASNTKKYGTLTKYISKLSYKYYLDKMLDKTQLKFSVTDKCNQCGICEKVCPVHNIKVKDKPIYSVNCESCLACVHHCPNNAINMQGEKSNKRFRNQNIELSEIINSNNYSY